MRTCLALAWLGLITVQAFMPRPAEARDTLEGWTALANEITAQYEGSSFGKVTNDFDCQGMSIGKSQYTFAQGSVGDFFQKFQPNKLKRLIEKHMPTHGDVFSRAVKLNIDGRTRESTRLIRSLQRPLLRGQCVTSQRRQQRPRFVAGAEAEIRALMSDPAVVKQQIAKQFRMGQRALKIASCWAEASRDDPQPTFQEFVFFNDFLTQNGAKWLALSQLIDIATKINLKTSFGITARERRLEKVENLVEWMKANWSYQHRPTYARDAQRNAQLVEAAFKDGRLSDTDLRLLYVAFMRANLGRNIFSYVVFNRRVGIVLGQGYLNSASQPYDFRAVYRRAGKIDPIEVRRARSKYLVRRNDLCQGF